MRRILTLTALFAVLGVAGARAQYYDWGQDPASVKWRVIKTPDLKLIYPDTYERNSVRIMNYMDTVRNWIGYGFTHGPMRRIPVVIHSQNFSSNGIMMLAPKRMELIVTPGSDQFAFPALKQLSVHEYRHAVQYNNLNRGLIKVLSYILGQQGSLVGLGFMPMWAIEGDAVLAETQMSTYGRGLQPSFSIEYRAMALEGTRRFPKDKYFSGSYRDNMPDHYRLGYQILSWADDHYSENVLDKAAWFSSRNAYMIFPFSIGLKKFYGTNAETLFTDSFDSLFEYWRSLPLEENTARIVETPRTSYTTYETPRALNEREAVAVKTDLDRTYRLVGVNVETGEETVLCRTGIVNSPLSVGSGKVYWTEYRQSTFWQQRVHSQLCWYDLTTGRKGTSLDHRNLLFPTAMPGGEAAAVEYNIDGSYRIVHGERQWNIPDTVTVHGLTFESETERFYFIGLSDAGMWIGAVGEGANGIDFVTAPSYTSLSKITGGDGKLYFNSIASGKDEAHMIDLASGKQYRLTTSRYGSFSPSPMGEGIVLTTYTPEGYLLSRQGSGAVEQVQYSRVPQNKVNPPRRKWDVVNMDEVTVSDSTSLKSKRYRKGLNLFYFHSWAPVYFDADEIMSESNFDVMLGATVMSQNNLNSTYTQFGYAWDGDHSLVRGKFHYSGWAPKLELKAEWSNRPQSVIGRTANDPEPRKIGDHWEFDARAYLPFTLSSGASFRSLTPSVQYQWINTKIYNAEDFKYRVGLNKLTFGLQYAESRRMAHRDFLPPLGYALRVNYTLNPTNDDFGKLWTVFGRAYLPGFAPHHSVTLRAAFQDQKAHRYVFRQKEVFPRGADYDAILAQRYMAVSGDYQFPLWYPDGGINSILYFRRIRLSLGGDYARYRDFGSVLRKRAWNDVWSCGADIVLDVVPLRLPSNTSTTVTISIRKPSDRKGIWGGVNVSLPL